MKLSKAEREHARGCLLAVLNRGQVVSVVERTVAKSGASRTLTLLTARDGIIYDLSFNASRLMGWTRIRGVNAFRISGGGMDMCFAAVNDLAQALFGDGQALRYERI